MSNEVKDNLELSQETEKVLNLDEKITLRNLAPWEVGFKRIDSIGDVNIAANGTVRLTRNEVIQQVQNGNRLLSGIDNVGSHATVFIEDKETRIELDFESADGKRTQKIVTDDAITKLFEYKTMKTFQEKLADIAITRAEKSAVINIVKKLKLNETATYEKMAYVMNYCKFQLR